MATTTIGREPVKVETYAGYRAGETPRHVYINGKSYDISTIIYRKRVVHLDNYDEEEHFRVEIRNYGGAVIIYHPRYGIWQMETGVVPEKKFSEMV
jgi:hypothetical protein